MSTRLIQNIKSNEALHILMAYPPLATVNTITMLTNELKNIKRTITY